MANKTGDEVISEKEITDLVETLDKQYRPTIPLDEFGAPSELSEVIKQTLKKGKSGGSKNGTS